jgi:hypothetical protein
MMRLRSPIELAEWLDSIKFKKAKWSRQPQWKAGNVNAIIRKAVQRKTGGRRRAS